MFHRLIFQIACVAMAILPLNLVAAETKPLRVLLITGGCCHNYPFQTQQFTNAMANLTPAEWTVVMDGGNGTRAEISLYNNPDWANGFDVVVHNECFADTTNPDYLRKITRVHHAGVPAVVIHCAMHTYRAAEIDDWREFLGVTSKRHDHQSKYPVKLTQPEHPILQGIATNWVTPMDELYIIEKVWPQTEILATSVSERDGKAHPVIWTHQYGKARVFGTTFGHSDEMWRDENFLKLVTRGTLWAAGQSDTQSNSRK